MELKDILSITGSPGLFKLVAPAKGGFIVESLVDGKRTSVSASGVNHPVFIAELGIFTKGEDMPMAEVFKKMNEQDGKQVDPKSDEKTLRAYFKGVIPE